ncbi:hypothetical protein [Arthrobacter sp.]|uniref:hypothetical protein n=1 Tax=Arthrobacter sp. TaxID=1667 RepID=UPI003A920A79
MAEPKATLDDIYRQNESIIGLLERLNENLHHIREATYGQTVEESGKRFDQPKHGVFGAIAESKTETESILSEIRDALSKK